ncbi:MAG: aminotransferase class IV [Candidatus Obscuribacterales bacterium]
MKASSATSGHPDQVTNPTHDARQIVANWNGQQMPLADVKVSVLDRAFTFGDSIYEVVRIYGGQLFRFSDHLDRMRNGLNDLKIKADVSEIEKNVRLTLANSGVLDGIVYIQVTRGEAPRQHRYPENCQPNVLIYADRIQTITPQVRAEGVKVITHPDIRWGRNDIKQTGLTANCIVAQAAAEKNCREAIMIDAQGLVTEGSHTTIFGVKSGKLIVPPPSPKVLPGITKIQVLELAQSMGIEVERRFITAEELFGLDEVFLAGTTCEVLAVVSIDDRAVGTGRPGPVLTRLEKAFEQVIREHAPPSSSANS